MKNAFQTRILAVVLAAATLAACVFAGFNISAENNYKVPTDGIFWIEAPAGGPAGLCARQVPVDSPGYTAGVRQGDVLVSVDDRPTPRVPILVEQMFRDGPFGNATYSVLRAPQSAAELCRVPAGTKPFAIQGVILQPAGRC